MLGWMLVLVVGGSLVFLLYLRDRAVEAAAADTQAVVRLLDEHLTRTLTATDGVLRRAVRVAQARLGGAISDAEQVRELRGLQDSLPERGGVRSPMPGGW